MIEDEDDGVVDAREIVVADDGAVSLMKALGPERTMASATLTNEDELLFREHNAIAPPYPLAGLACAYECSGHLVPNITAYMNGVEAFGHRFEERLATDPEKRREEVADAIFAERVSFDIDDDDLDDSMLATDEEIAERMARISLVSKKEWVLLKNLFASICPDMSFVKLRMQTRLDLEIYGFAFWEVLRTPAGRVSQFRHMEAPLTRLLPKDAEHTEVETVEPVSMISHRRARVMRRFRGYLQVSNGDVVYFKEFGDSRVTSRKTGKKYASVGQMRSAEGAVEPAHEVIHFFIASPLSPYGAPRWIGVTPDVMGSRAAGEVNAGYFESKSVPPLAILVQGGKLTDAAVARIEDHIANNIMGRKNFHRVLVLEGVSGGSRRDASAANVKIEIQPLTSAQLTDAQFLGYIDHAGNTVGAMFRLPPITRGQTKDFNRATAEAATMHAEVSVFEPLRQEFDDWMNRLLQNEFGIRFWRFVSNAPVNRDVEVQSKLAAELSAAGAIVPRDSRHIAGEVFNTQLPPINAKWADIPLPLAIQAMKLGIPLGIGDDESDQEDGDNGTDRAMVAEES